MKIPVDPQEDFLKSDEFSEAVIAAAIFAAENSTQSLTASVEAISDGGKFVIPLLIPEGVESGDGRSFKENSLTHRQLPLPLLWQIKTADGHDGSPIVGRIDHIERVKGGLGNAYGVFDAGGVHGREAERLVRGGFLRGISADLDNFEGSAKSEELAADSDPSEEAIKAKKISVSSARVMSATLVPKPAFQECHIMIKPETSATDDTEASVKEGVYSAPLEDDEETVIAALAASAAPIVPPREWFVNPELKGPTPLNIDENGKVYGHIAAWHVDHIGLSAGVKPPRSASKYAYFRTGVVRTEDGSDVQVGQLTLAGGHASLSASAKDAVKHYDDTASAIADVTAGEDQYGIWVAGALRPEATPIQVRALRASAPSGDWRPINGRLELVAVCQVNVPGFPNVRAMVSSGQQITALVAAGTAPLIALRESKVDSLAAKVHNIEQASLREKAATAQAKLTQLNTERIQAIAASAQKRMQSLLDAQQTELQRKAEEARNRLL